MSLTIHCYQICKATSKGLSVKQTNGPKRYGFDQLTVPFV
ncbi:hypothetical protein SLEP1_g23462 [Rubroshorea leprosula]|uniref:Uncharacterized protein n=1 Tax=Rubroshorea leprosula TaxID=152421 RepID=A0AAV5JPI3_9ROSI|nr:hypothetical protein SLEP1_g23462 [Rubroshorea leprosula]